jgi:anaerobic magnesium-protoporphyrin IX monomethyl ester cyclase
MKVCLVRPPSIIGAASFIGSITPPIGLAYLAGSLRAAGHDVVLIDGVGEDPLRSEPVSDDGLLVARGLAIDDLIARVPADADLIGVSAMFSSEWPVVRDFFNRLGAHFPDTFMIGGGEHLTALAEFSMGQCPCIKAVAVGEGEETLLEAANALESGKSLEAVAGLVLRQPNGDFHRTGPRARIRNIDAIPAPAWDLIPLENYLSNGLTNGVNLGRSMPMLASRGCPYQCTFCSSPFMWTTRWLSRDPIILVDEIVQYQSRYAITNVDFYDLTAIVKRDWIIKFCQELIRRNIKITWQLPSGTRSEAIDAEVARLLALSGCRNLSYAPESGSERTLAAIKKKIKLDRMLQSLTDSIRAGLNVKTNILIGFPGETHRDVLVTFWFLLKLSFHGAHDVSVSAFAPYPGSELYEQLRKAGKVDLSDAYFRKLAYVDISSVKSYCENISDGALKRYLFVGFLLFYLSNYLFRPLRAFRTFANLISGQHASRGEMALAQLLMRLKTMVASNG